MEEEKINIKKVESFRELESQIDKEQLISCDDIQNSFVIIHLSNTIKIGIAYYNYGIGVDSQYSGDGRFMYVGFGKNLLCIDIYENKVVSNDKLQSVFYELLYDRQKKYICVICELDIYCYYLEHQKWKIGFRDIIEGYSIIDDIKIAILCDNGNKYLFFLENGKIVK